MALTGQFTDIPSGTLVPTLSGNKLSAPFNMKAQFDNGGGSCADGEYRQYVKGKFTVDGEAVAHALCGSVLLSPTVFQEDGCPPLGCTAYGYRECPDHPYNLYLPDRATGGTYEGYDAPGISSSAPGATVAMDLSFRGQLINKSNGAILATAEWKVVGSASIPMKELTSYRIPSLVAGGKPQVHIARSGKDWIVSLLFSGRPDGPAETLEVSVVDEKGKALAIQPADTVEVGGVNTVTRVLKLKVAGDSGRPASVKVQSGAEKLDLPIVE